MAAFSTTATAYPESTENATYSSHDGDEMDAPDPPDVAADVAAGAVDDHGHPR